MDLYRDLILDHYKHPRNFGRLANPQLSVDQRNSSCGDTIHFELTIDENHCVREVAFDGDGCAISRAATSLLTDYIKNKAVSDLRQLQASESIELCGTITPARLRCAILPFEALQVLLAKI